MKRSGDKITSNLLHFSGKLGLYADLLFAWATCRSKTPVHDRPFGNINCDNNTMSSKLPIICGCDCDSWGPKFENTTA